MRAHPYASKSFQPITVLGFPLGPAPAQPSAKKDLLPTSNLPSAPASSGSSSREPRFNLNGAVVALVLIALLSLMNDDEKRQSEDLILLQQQLQLALKVIPPGLALGALLCVLCVALALFVFTTAMRTAAAAASAKRPNSSSSSSSEGRLQALEAVVCARSREGEELC